MACITRHYVYSAKPQQMYAKLQNFGASSCLLKSACRIINTSPILYIYFTKHVCSSVSRWSFLSVCLMYSLQAQEPPHDDLAAIVLHKLQIDPQCMIYILGRCHRPDPGNLQEATLAEELQKAFCIPLLCTAFMVCCIGTTPSTSQCLV